VGNDGGLKEKRMADEEFVFRGSLAETPLPAMLATIHRHGVPGVMEFSRDGETKRICFLDGDVIFATSSVRSESLGDYLLSIDKLTKAQYRVSCDELARSPGKRHGTILVQMGFVEPEELGKLVGDQIYSILWSLFNWGDGEVSFRVGRFREDEVHKIKVFTPRVIIEGCKNMADARIVTARLGGRHAVYAPVARAGHLERLRLESGEQKLLDLVDGKATLVELCERGPFSPGVNARVVYAFAELQMLERDRDSAPGIRIQVRSGDDAPAG